MSMPIKEFSFSLLKKSIICKEKSNTANSSDLAQIMGEIGCTSK